MSDVTGIIKIVGVVVSSNGITIFVENGGSLIVSGETHNTEDMIGKIAVNIAANGFCELNLDDFIITKKVEEIEKKIDVKINEQTKEKEIDLGNNVIVKADDVQHLIDQAAFSNNEKGLKEFLKRMKGVAKKRKHTVNELLEFMKRGRMPIANDGAIIAYKILKKTKKQGVFVDPHTGRVEQKVGSHVYMPESKVDDNRRADCGVGLHVCTRGYINSFWGNDRVLTLVKVYPENIITVPTNESTKMRACAYQIVRLLSQEEVDHLRRNGDEFANEKLVNSLKQVVYGNHAKLKESVAVYREGEFKNVKKEVKQIERKGKIGDLKTKKDALSVENAKAIIKDAKQSIFKKDDYSKAINQGIVERSEVIERSVDTTNTYFRSIDKAILGVNVPDSIAGAITYILQERYIGNESSIRGIAERFNVSRTTLTKYLRLVEAAIQKQKEETSTDTDDKYEPAIRHFKEKGGSLTSIAKAYNVTRSVLTRKLEKLGLWNK